MVLEEFYARVAAAPGAIAVQDGALRLTYAELAGQAASLAVRLTARGVTPDSVVAVYAGRSAHLVVGELAALLAGAAYLPLDPAHPVARTGELLALSQAAAVVTTAALAPAVSAFGAPVLPVTLDEPPAPLPALVRPDGAALAYIIYTSGSTGRPKGVAVSHASLANLMRWHQADYRLTAADRTTLLVSPGFDVSVWDTWPTLATGGTLVVPPAEVRTSPADLVTWLAGERITVTFLPTPLAEAVLDEPWPAGVALRLMHTGGSAMLRGVPDGLPFDLVNVYGPAECTVGSSTATVRPGGPVPPPIGLPAGGVSAYVLDGLDPVPDGEPGELCLAGACVARGYLHDPAGTARSFVPDIGGSGRRMYRTGDRVRRGPDGVLEYLGRLDDQAKIRGFRIEPGEVAAVLRQHPGVRDSYVAAERSGHPDARLVAWVAGPVTPAELTEFTAARLPGYMVPAAIVVLPALPMTPNGKVDRAALPAPDRAAAGLSGTAATYATATEAALAALVARLLGLGKSSAGESSTAESGTGESSAGESGTVEVGAGDDFFALGGTSLLVGKLAAAIAAELGVKVSLAELFQSRTVAAIAAIIDERAAAAAPGQEPVAPPTVAPARPPIARANRDRPIPLSLPQQRVWYFEQLSPGNLAYNFQASVALTGPVDVPALQAALNEIVRRHEILRTAFVSSAGEAWLRPQPSATAPLQVLDVPAGDAEQVIAASLRQPFDLNQPPLARWMLLRHDLQHSTFVHVEHHFVHDGWSLGVFLSELSALYPACLAGEPSPLPELAVQYADYACWQRDWMRGEVLRAHVDHWTAKLAGAPDVLELPADRPRPPVMTFRGAAPRIRIPAELGRALRAFSREHQVSLFATMYAGFAALLHRYTGRRDLLVGTGAANRNAPELEPLLGMLVNTLVLRTAVTPDQPFAELLRGVQETVIETLAWADTPVDAVIDAMAPARDTSRTPLFQVMFSFHDSAVPDLDFGGLTGAVTERSNRTAKSDLNVIVIPRAAQRLGRAPRPEDDDLNMIWEHSTDLFDEATMTRMVAHYLALLADAVARPDTPVRALRLLSGQESDQLADWSRGPAVTGARPVTELTAHWIATTPDTIAVTDPQVSLTYRELGERSGRLAAALAALGAGPETVVALYAGRSAHLITAQLAASTCGAAYLPLDPDYPAARVADLLATSGATVLLTTSDLAGNLPPFAGPTLLLDADADWPAGEQVPAPAPASPDALAYVIYTSGSTGQPKGVQVSHGSLANLVGWLRDAYSLTPGARSTLLASPAFDGSVWEIWPTLGTGGTLVVPPEDVRAVPRDLAAWLAAQQITWSFMPTPLAEATLDGPWPDGTALRLLVTGGDAIRRTTPAGLPFTFVNNYGPTETTVIATHTPVPPGGPERPPIGRPLGGVRAYVLDGLEPVPAGVPGELCLAGAGVARGYLGDPAATAAVFVPDPWHPGQRMYRTGDRARWRPDGQLEFLGRQDEQVKIRGFRVEPGEIAATLRRHPEVSDAVVLARRDSAGRMRLAGYAATTASPDELRSFLAGQLPGYLVPDHLIALAALPWTPNGKVDRAALPDPADLPTRPAEPLRTGTERRLAALWGDLLGVTAIGSSDDFFGLGGYSLLVAKMLAQVEEAFGTTVPLPVFLAAPTLASLAAALDGTTLDGTTPDGTVPVPAARPDEPADGLAGLDIDSLSDAEAAALLAVLTGDGED